MDAKVVTKTKTFQTLKQNIYIYILAPPALLPCCPAATLALLPPYYSGAAMVPHPASHIIFGQHHSLEILPEASAFKVKTLVELQ